MNTEVLKHLRIITGLKQKELAEEVGISPSLLQKVENGERTLQTNTEDKLLEVFNGYGIDDNSINLLEQIFQSKNMKKVRKDWGAN